jgi:hypothetical protein
VSNQSFQLQHVVWGLSFHPYKVCGLLGCDKQAVTAWKHLLPDFMWRSGNKFKGILRVWPRIATPICGWPPLVSLRFVRSFRFIYGFPLFPLPWFTCFSSPVLKYLICAPVDKYHRLYNINTITILLFEEANGPLVSRGRFFWTVVRVGRYC